MKSLAKREVLDLDDDIEFADRRELDDAVFELLGEKSSKSRQEWIGKLYSEIVTFYTAMKDKELLAVKNRAITSRGSTISVKVLAQEIWEAVDSSLKKRFPEDFFNPANTVDHVDLTEGKLRVVLEPLIGNIGITIDGEYTELGDEQRVQLVKSIYDTGRRGSVPVPQQGKVCAAVLHHYRVYENQVLAEFAGEISQKTANERMQAKVLDLLKHKLAQLDT